VARLERSCHGNGASRLRWANAGHPPPIVVGPDGGTTFLGGPVGDLMLGVDCTVDRAESVLDVAPDSTVLLYTDGLIERRGSSIDDGMARLVHHLGQLAGRPLEELCDALLDRMLQGTPQDDVAIVAVRLSRCCHPGG
jgi:serine phosphatase RsbU (regulator of sigma subunit)